MKIMRQKRPTNKAEPREALYLSPEPKLHLHSRSSVIRNFRREADKNTTTSGDGREREGLLPARRFRPAPAGEFY